MVNSECADKVMDIIAESDIEVDEDVANEWRDRLLKWFAKDNNDVYAWMVAEVGIVNGFAYGRLEALRDCDVRDGAHAGAILAEEILSDKLDGVFESVVDAAFHAMLGSENDAEVTAEQKAGMFAAVAVILDTHGDED